MSVQSKLSVMQAWNINFCFLPGLHVEEFLPLHCPVINQQVNFQQFFLLFPANLFLFNPNFLLPLCLMKKHYESTKLQYFFWKKIMKNVCTLSDIIDHKQSKASKVSVKTCWVTSTLRRWSSGQRLPLRANSRQERTWTYIE